MTDRDGAAYSFADGHAGDGVSAVTLILDDGTRCRRRSRTAGSSPGGRAAHDVKSADDHDAGRRDHADGQTRVADSRAARSRALPRVSESRRASRRGRVGRWSAASAVTGSGGGPIERTSEQQHLAMTRSGLLVGSAPSMPDRSRPVPSLGAAGCGSSASLAPRPAPRLVEQPAASTHVAGAGRARVPHGSGPGAEAQRAPVGAASAPRSAPHLHGDDRHQLRDVRVHPRRRAVTEDIGVVLLTRQARLLRRADIPAGGRGVRDPGRRPDRDRRRADPATRSSRRRRRTRSTCSATSRWPRPQTQPPGASGSQFFIVTGQRHAVGRAHPRLRAARQGRLRNRRRREDRLAAHESAPGRHADAGGGDVEGTVSTS